MNSIPGFSIYWRVSFLVPAAGNDGIPFPPSYFHELEAHIREVVGAFSVRESPIRGEWGLSRDVLREYFVDVGDAELARDLAVAILKFVLKRFDQEAVALEVVPRYSSLNLTLAQAAQLSSRFAWIPEVAYARAV